MNRNDVITHLEATFQLTLGEAVRRTAGIYEDLEIAADENITANLLAEIEHCVGYDIKKGR